MDERRERDPDTGEHIYVGTGISDIFAKITGKTAKKIATKAAEKGMEKIGEKTGQLIGEKIYNKFTKPPPPKPELGGQKIMEMLQEPPKTDKFQYIKDVYNDLL